jgi:hypothetical protein
MNISKKIALFTLLFLITSADAPATFDCTEAASSPWERFISSFSPHTPHRHSLFTRPVHSDYRNVSTPCDCYDDFLNSNETSNGADYIDFFIYLSDFLYPAADFSSSLLLSYNFFAFQAISYSDHLSRYQKIERTWEIYNYAMFGFFAWKTIAYPITVIEEEKAAFYDLFQEPNSASTLNVINSYVSDRRDLTCGALQALSYATPVGRTLNEYIQEHFIYQATDFLVLLNLFINFHMADIHSIYLPVDNIDDQSSLLSINDILCSASRAIFRLATLVPGRKLDLEKSVLFPGMYTLFLTFPSLYSITHLTLKTISLPFGMFIPLLAEATTFTAGYYALKMLPDILNMQAVLFVVGQFLYYTTSET